MKLKEGYILDSFCRRYVLKSKDDPSTVIKFNETAAFLWQKATEKGDFNEDELYEALSAEYEVEETVARDAINQTIQGWTQLGLLE